LHLVLAALGLDSGRRTRVGLVSLYAAAATVAIVGAATYDPFLDAACIDCTWDNPLLVMSRYGLPRYRRLAEAAVVLVSGVAMGITAIYWLTGRHRIRSPRTVVAVAALGVALAGGIRGVLLVATPREDPRGMAWTGAWGLLLVSVLVLSVGFGWLAVASWRRAVQLREVVASLEAAPAPGAVGQALGRALDDPGLRIGYWLDDPGRYVDAQGAPMEPVTGRGMTVTPIERDGGRLATILHADRVDGQALAGVFGPAMLVAVDNDRLRAARLAQLEELRASRTRIVAVSDGERRRLERDLHDGAQQQLLSILFDLRLARLAAERSGDPDRVNRLVACERLAQDAVDELRRMAHGIHPAVLSRSGLIAALMSLADEAAIPIEVEAGAVGRVPEAVETAAYIAVWEALAGAIERGASSMSVGARLVGDTLSIEARDDGPPGTSNTPVRIADRVGAAGGQASSERLADGGTLLRVELPCV
ncbi:MAG: histidine kinase, partial [Chloroflexi bacterium]|nr:histidine kinase [Chloroflexota bacterium]